MDRFNEQRSDSCQAGTVVELRGELALVEVEPSMCGGCAQEGACNLLAGKPEKSTVLALNRAGAGPGDPVSVELSAAARTKSACLLYVIPSISLVVGAAVGQQLLAGVGSLDPVLAGLFGALVFLALGMIPAMVVSRRKMLLPIVSQVREESVGNR